MESHREEQQKALKNSAQQKPKRFRIVKLEERIAPSKPVKQTAACGAVTFYGDGCPIFTAAWQCKGPTVNPEICVW